MAKKPKPSSKPRRKARNGRSKRAVSYADFVRTGPGTIAGEYLRSFWQPVHRASDVATGQAKPIRIMSEDLTLFRGDDGTAHIVAGRCAHRGAKLSIGWVEGNTIKCAYHGWTYDGDGQCLRQPAEPKPFCNKVKIRSYPTQEYLGLIFAYLGDGEPPPMVRYPEFEEPEYLYDLATNLWNCNYWAQLENALDIAHTEFLHWHFHYKTPERVVTERTPFGVKGYSEGLSGMGSFYDTVYFHMPNTHEWCSPPLRGEKIGYFAKSWRIPRDDDSHIRFDLKVVPLKGEMARDYKVREAERTHGGMKFGQVNDVTAEILNGNLDFKRVKAEGRITGSDLVNVQDCTVMTSLNPMDERGAGEWLGRTDLGIVMLRRLWEHELAAFAAGRKLTDWKRPATLWHEIKEVAKEMERARN
jgi:5,5'-dehydrodivanillate O-demethylase